jgi:hypothetical protein
MKGILTTLFLSCKRATELVEKKATFSLSPIEAIQLRMHLGMCDACALYQKYSQKMDKILLAVLKKSAAQNPPPAQNADLKERIQKKIDLQ